MKRVIFATSVAILFAVSTNGGAVTDNPDGSVTLTKDEATVMLQNFQYLDSEIKRLEGEVARANIVFGAMQRRIAEIKSAQDKCI